MVKKRVAILTDYYGSGNCGGLLQAYAMQKVIAELGYECRQISFCAEYGISARGRIRNFLALSNTEKRDRVLRKIKGRISSSYRKEEDAQRRNVMEQREKAKAFADSIQHTSRVYNLENIGDTCQEFDGFVCGSDIIWQPGRLYDPSFSAYFLAFAPLEKRKISYAASIGAESIDRAYTKKVRPWLARLDAISVRETSAQRLLKSEMDISSTVVADPTMLLSDQAWKDSLSLDGGRVEGIFCYLLGGNDTYSPAVRELADRLGCGVKLLNGGEHALKTADGTDTLDRLTPPEFLQAILDGQYIVTDSFHCVVFSILFHKQFIALPRYSAGNRNSINARITDFLASAGLQDWFVSDPSNALERLLEPIDYSAVDGWMEDYRNQSREWLARALESK